MEEQRLKFTIERFDHYYASINNKVSALLVLVTFIIGGLIALTPTVSQLPECTIVMGIQLCVLIAIGLTAMILLIIALRPRLGASGSSLLFFMDISRLTRMQFADSSGKQTHDEHIEDLREQVYCLSKGLASKFRLLRLASTIVWLQFTLMIPFIILVVIHI